jgi:pimeloyl-ACP methyl ester carboxylesterase
MSGTNKVTGATPDLGAIRRELLLALLAGGLASLYAATSAEGADMPRHIDSTASDDGTAIRFAVRGNGAPLVLLHGFTDSLESWAEVGYVGPLLDAGYRLILIDQRGHGGSGRPHDAAAYAAELIARDVIAVLDALGIERASILGYSMGGWAALNVARFFSDRIDRLIVGGAQPFGQSMAPQRNAVRSEIAAWIGILEQLGGPLPRAWKERIESNDIVALRAAVANDRPDISVEIAGFPRPCLFYAGGDDPLHQAVARTPELMPRARFVSLAGRNHLTALLRVDLVVPQVLAFLNEPALESAATRT